MGLEDEYYNEDEESVFSEKPQEETPAAAPSERVPVAQPVSSDEVPDFSAAEEGGEARSWYVVHCYSGYENKVRHNLEQRIETMGMKDRIFDVVIPTQEEIEVKTAKGAQWNVMFFPAMCWSI